MGQRPYQRSNRDQKNAILKYVTLDCFELKLVENKQMQKEAFSELPHQPKSRNF